MKIDQLLPDERPREKVIRRGASSLDTSELLAVLLRTGCRGLNAVDVARLLLRQADNSLLTLERCSLQAMCRVKGVGMDKAVTVAAAMELGKRLALGRLLPQGGSVGCPEDAEAVLRPLFAGEDKEECWCLFLKRSRHVIGSLKVSEGGQTMTEINIKKIVQKALDLGASYVLLSHNHPSGDPSPSAADLQVTQQLKTALEVFEVGLMDHIILSEDRYYSFSEDGR